MGTPLSKNRIPMTPSEYAIEWSQSSSDHKRFSDYQWIAEHLTDPKIVFEIGCGSGNGTAALLKRGSKVVSVEINQDLLQQTTNYLQSDGYKVELIPLSQVDKIDIDSETQCFLIEADVFDADAKKIFSTIKFDHILFSFFGAAPLHAALGLGIPLEELDSQFARNYREKATLVAYDFKKICGDECKLIIVDRVHQEKGFSARQIREFYANDLAVRLGVPIEGIRLETRKNQAMQRPSTSAMQYINDGSFAPRAGTPLIAIAKI